MAYTTMTGLDFNGSTVNVAIIRKSKQTFTILAMEQYEFKESIVTDNEGREYQNLVNKLRKLKNRQPLFQHQVAFALPDSAVMTKVIPVDKRLPLEQQFLMATHQFTSSSPLPLSELSLDFIPHESGIEVYAAKREAIAQRQTPILRSGMKLALIDLEKQAFLQLILLASEEPESLTSSFFLVEISSYAITLGFLTSSVSFYRHLSLPVGAKREPMTLEEKLNRVVEELERVRSMYPQLQWQGVWLIGTEVDSDVVDKLKKHSQLSVSLYPVGSVFKVKGSWVTQSSLYGLKACAIAVRGLVAMDAHYAA